MKNMVVAVTLTFLMALGCYAVGVFVDTSSAFADPS